jgi:putative membrane protein
MLAAVIEGAHLLLVLGVLIGALVILLASAEEVSAQDLLAINRVYALTAIAMFLLALAGTVLWFWGAKPATFYSNNPVFHAKLCLFALLCLLFAHNGYRIYRLHKRYAADESAMIALGKSVRVLQKAMIPLLIAIPVTAYLMARGIGY